MGRLRSIKASPTLITSSNPAMIDRKNALLELIEAFNEAKDREGDVSIDFGVKGGELDSDTRAPSIVNYYSVSESLGKACDAVLVAIQDIVNSSTPIDATKFLGTEEGAMCPLHGAWKNIFTTAADATFSENSKRGDANVFNVLDGKTGNVWNVINFKPRKKDDAESVKKPKESPLGQLRVRLSSKATSKNRVQLIFRFVKIHLRRFLFYRKPVTLTIPVPGPFFTSILFFFMRKKMFPPAYFDVLYLDNDLRIHKTGQGAFFVQMRPQWSRVI